MQWRSPHNFKACQMQTNYFHCILLFNHIDRSYIDMPRELLRHGKFRCSRVWDLGIIKLLTRFAIVVHAIQSWRLSRQWSAIWFWPHSILLFLFHLFILFILHSWQDRHGWHSSRCQEGLWCIQGQIPNISNTCPSSTDYPKYNLGLII